MDRLLLFDLDGTLTDPYRGIANCIRFAFECLDHPAPNDEQLRLWIGPPLLESFATALGGDRTIAERAVGHYRERFAEHGLFENEAIEGMARVLELLVEQGQRCVLATSKPTVYASRIVEHFGFDQVLATTYGSQLDGRLSDKAELIKDIMRRENQPAERLTMIGDRKHDIVGAHANGVRAIGVLWGFGDEFELRQAGADHIAAQPDDLLSVLRI